MSSEEACLARAILLSVSLAGTEGAVGKTEVTTKMDRWIDTGGSVSVRFSLFRDQRKKTCRTQTISPLRTNWQLDSVYGRGRDSQNKGDIFMVSFGRQLGIRHKLDAKNYLLTKFIWIDAVL